MKKFASLLTINEIVPTSATVPYLYPGAAPARNKWEGEGQAKRRKLVKKVWGASPRKFRNFRINLVHSGVYTRGFFVEMGI